MLRFLFIPFILLITVLLAIILFWFVYKKVKRGVDVSIKKGAALANDQQQKWAEKEQRKKQPEIIQQGFRDYEKIKAIVKLLPEEWKNSLDPIVIQAKCILEEISLEFDTASGKTKSEHQNKKLNSIRPFFIHSLNALLQFVEKLKDNYSKMTKAEIEKAQQNITLFKSDLLDHQETLHKVRRFDFDVTMDVIKARLKR